MKRLSLALVSLIGLVSSAFAQTSYNRFGPATGVLKGDAATYYTSAADSSDIRALWSGTCDITTFLRGDGACAAASITGQALTRVDDTNVTLTLGGSPSTALVNPASLTLGWTGQLSAARGGTGVSSLGNLTDVDDTNVTLTLGGTPTGALINSTSITAGWTGTLSVPRGGIGVGTLTGIAKGNGTSAFTAAASSDVIGLWTGTCNSGTFLRADGTCQAVGGGSGSVTSISAATGITATPNPITTTGSIGIDFTGNYTWTGQPTFAQAGTSQAIFNGSAASASYFTLATTGTPYGYLGAGSAITSSAGGAALGGVNRIQLATGGSASTLRLDIDNTNITASLPIIGTSTTFSGDGSYAGRQFSAGGTLNASTAVQLCHAGSGYASIGVNVVCTSSAGVYNYGVSDAAGQIDFGNIQTRGWTFRSAVSGTAGNPITFTDVASISNTGTVSGTTAAFTTGTFTNATVGGSAVCRADGTNCPTSSGPTLVVKPSAEDRSSTTALATDTDLQFAATSGQYAIEFCLYFAGVSTGTQGFKFAFNITSVGNQPGMWGGSSRVNAAGAAHSGIFLGDGTGNTGGQVAFATISTGNGTNMICGQGGVFNSGSVTYAIQWAQNSSSANATRLGQGSFIRYQKVL